VAFRLFTEDTTVCNCPELGKRQLATVRHHGPDTGFEENENRTGDPELATEPKRAFDNLIWPTFDTLIWPTLSC
jgi:hypothetical protein